MDKQVDPNKAKQGRRGTPVLIVLICGLLLALVVWWGVGLFGSAIAPEDPVGGAPAEQPAEAPSTAPPAELGPQAPAQNQ